MRSRRYFAPDIRSAVLKVRQELGSNAVILAHQRIQSGVEVTAISGKESPNSILEEPATPIDDDTLCVKNVRDSYENSYRNNIQYFAAGKNGVSKTGLITKPTDSNRVGIDKMHDKTAKPYQNKDRETDRANKESHYSVEYDFEAEMNMILNSHPPELAEMQRPVESDNAEDRSSSKQNSENNNKQTVIKSKNSPSSQESFPPLFDSCYDYGSLVDAMEQKIGENAFGEAARKNPAKASLIKQLMKLDLSPAIIQSVADALVSDKTDQKMLFPQAMALLANQIPVYKEDVTAIGGTVALFGATGVGKTTTIAKLAARYALRHGADKVALITTDDNRIAATEQLRTYSNILGMPLRIARDDVEVLNALNTFSEKEFVLIDTAGMTPNEINKSKFYDLFSGGITQIKKFLVMPATMHREALEISVRAFSDLSPDGCIVTKMDETTSLGGAISVIVQNQLPVAFYGNGQTVPDDFHLARAHILMSRVVDLAAQFNGPESGMDSDSNSNENSDSKKENYTPGIINNVGI